MSNHFRSANAFIVQRINADSLNRSSMPSKPLAQEYSENTDVSKKHTSQSYHDVFENIESDLLLHCSYFKASLVPRGRGVAHCFAGFDGLCDIPRYYFGKGRPMLVPYVEFELLQEKDKPIALEHIFLWSDTEYKHFHEFFDYVFGNKMVLILKKESRIVKFRIVNTRT